MCSLPRAMLQCRAFCSCTWLVLGLYFATTPSSSSSSWTTDRGGAAWFRHALAFHSQKKLIFARHNKLIIVQRNRLISVQHKKLNLRTIHGHTSRKTRTVPGNSEETPDFQWRSRHSG